jgi:hypothetical protein
MNTIQIVAMTLVYLLPVALVTLLLTTHFPRQPRWLLTAVLLVLPLFYVGHYLLLQQLPGWPSHAPLPQQFRLLGFDIVEPDTKAGKSGRILLWISAADSDPPRVHQLPYGKDLHQELIAAGQRQAEGRVQLGSRSRQAAPPASSGQAGIAQDIISFSDAASQSLPAKR